ncbi:hypothetical protein HAZT_HAZT006683 [Hyalella azteca]|uniref:Phosphomannomutase n=1 Tax=Hyalella azteca TaxID=294128 RepID=A0A6A0HAP9_HYAAZ|nr:hypothetical protein HAZT_HAZT006683 [Hyalella azteca]
MCSPSQDIILLFDVDGTLTAPRKAIEPKMAEFMASVRSNATCGIVGGSDLAKIAEQLGGMEVRGLDSSIYVLDCKIQPVQSIEAHMGEKALQQFINFSLDYMAKLELPAKRGTFVEFRSGLINLCPVGRSCSQELRDQFAVYDKEHKVREKFVAALREKFPDLGLTFSIGGQISIDAFPTGWDKTYCLQFIEKDFKSIHFFGDKTSPGGNDYEIFSDPRTIGHTVSSPADTRLQVSQLLQL